jgi:eukaryotic-like serine/threonine-protein kinase
MKDTCENCGKKVDRDFKFCPFCFHDFSQKSDELEEIDSIESMGEEDENEINEQEAESETSASEEQDEELLIAHKYRILEPLHCTSHGTVCKSESVDDPGSYFILRDFLIEERDAHKKEILIEKFFFTAEKLVNLSHANLASLLEYLAEGNYLYLIYEYTDGKFLDRVLMDFQIKKNQDVPEDIILQWSYQLCDLLFYLHNQMPEPIYAGVLRPSALMVRKSDSRIVFVQAGLIYLYEVLGILKQLEPEFASLRSQNASLAAYDMLCLGGVMYFLSTGIDPFAGDDYIPLKRRRKDLSGEMINLIERLLSIQKTQTFNSIDEVKAELENLLPDSAPVMPHEEISAVEAEHELTWRHYLGNPRRTNSFGDGPSRPLRILWSSSINASTQNFLIPYRNSLISLSDKGNLYTMDYAKGGIIKKESYTLNPVSPIIIGDQLCICSSSTQLSINIQDLAKKWDFRTKSMILCSPSYINNLLCYISYDGILIFVDPKDGKPQTMENLGAKIMSAPAFDEKRLYVTTLTGSLVAIELDSRIILWQYNTKSALTSAPTILGDNIFCGNNKGQLFAFNRENGEVVWEKSLKGSISQSVRIIRNSLIVYSTGGDLSRLMANDGSNQWSIMLKPHFDCPIACTESTIYLVDSENHLLFIDAATGEIRYHFQLPEKPNSLPLVLYDRIYISFASGLVLALEEEKTA